MLKLPYFFCNFQFLDKKYSQKIIIFLPFQIGSMKLCSIAAVHTSIRIQEDASIGERRIREKLDRKREVRENLGKSKFETRYSNFFCIRDAAVEGPLLKRESRLYTTLPGRKKRTLENVFSRLFWNVHVLCIFDIHPLLTV